MDGVVATGGLAHLRREAPVHALMIAVMAAAMLSTSSLVAIGGAAVLLVASIVCAALSRPRPFLREHIVDLWAMALVLLAFLPQHGAASGHHVITIASFGAFTLIGAGWLAVRLWLLRDPACHRPVAVASAALTGAGLVLMAVLCA